MMDVEEPWRHALFISGLEADRKAIIPPALAVGVGVCLALILGLKAAPIRALKKNAGTDASPKWIADPSQTFFFAHVLVNVVVCILCAYDTFRTFVDPIAVSISGDYDLLPTVIQVSFHLAHLITDWSNMKMELKIHHILSSLLLGTFDFYFVYGCILNSVCFFGTGLPGGLNYLLQFLRKLGAVRDSEANLIYCQLDTWIRMPGLILCISWGHAAWAQGAMKYGTPGWVQVLQIIFVMGNAVYFQAQAVEVYATKKERLKAEGSKGDGDDKEFKAKLPRKWAKQISQLPMLLFLAVCVLMPYITKHPNGTKTR